MENKNTNYIDNDKLEFHLDVLHQTYIEDLNNITDEILSKNKGMDSEEATKKAKKIARGYISEELGMMFLKIANNYINRNNFNKYTNAYRDEMIGLGIEYLCRFSKTFDKTNDKCNGFFFCTKICHNAFIQAITKEKKKSKLKDDIIKEAMNMSSESDKWTLGKSELL